MKSKIIAAVILAGLLIGLYKLFVSPSITNSPENNADIVIYWGIGCPHCEKVKEYIKTNQIDQKLKITLKEVYYNKKNQADLQSTAKQCPAQDTSQGIGVPFAFVPSDKSCLVGDTPII